MSLTCNAVVRPVCRVRLGSGNSAFARRERRPPLPLPPVGEGGERRRREPAEGNLVGEAPSPRRFAPTLSRKRERGKSMSPVQRVSPSSRHGARVACGLLQPADLPSQGTAPSLEQPCTRRDP